MTQKQARLAFFKAISVILLVFLILPASNIMVSGLPQDYKNESINRLFSIDQFEGHLNRILFQLNLSGDHNKVVVGKEDWLYLGNAHEKGLIRNRNFIQASDDEIDNWVSSMSSRQQWLAKQGIPMVVAIAPNKHSVYPEYLPTGTVIERPNSTDRLIEAAMRHNLKIIDLRIPLISEKQQHPYLYNKTDSHWTTLGAYVGYRAIMQEVTRRVPNTKYYQWDELTISPITHKACCLATMLKINALLDAAFDHNYKLDFDARKRPICRVPIGSTGEYENACQNAANHIQPIRKTASQVTMTPAKNTYSALLFKDSFGRANNHLFNATFNKTWHFHYQKTPKESLFKELVTTQSPSIVIYQIVERAIFSKPFYDFSSQG